MPLTAALYAILLWWFSTGAILWLGGLPRATHRWTLGGATLVLAAALCGMALNAHDTSVTGAYAGFTCGLLAWAWVETTFLLGAITGPRRAACPPGARGAARFRAAAAAILHHELAAIAVVLAALAITWGQPNAAAAHTLLLLWGMRLSTKLNLFLGVPNTNEGFLPDRLRYLGSYFARRRMNPLFPVSIVAATVVTGLLAYGAAGTDGTAAALLATLAALAWLEHWFLMLPIPVETFWRWGFRSRAPGTTSVQLRPVPKEAT